MGWFTTGLALLFPIALTVGAPLKSRGQSFVWPIDVHPIGQRYAAFNDGSPNKYHTGLDIGDGDYDYSPVTIFAQREDEFVYAGS